MNTKNKKRSIEYVIFGIISLYPVFFLTDSYFENNIENLTNPTPSALPEGKLFYIFLNQISDSVGKIGVQLIFGLLSCIIFFMAYIKYKQYKNDIIKDRDRLKPPTSGIKSNSEF